MSWKQVQTAFGEPDIDPDIKWKRCDFHIVQLKKSDCSVTNESRSGVVDYRFAKFRANTLVPVRIYNTKEDKWEQRILHRCGWREIVYQVDKPATPSGFSEDMDVVCGEGVHFFNTLLAAYWYTISRQPKEDIEFTHNGEIRHLDSTTKTRAQMLSYYGISNPHFVPLD